MMTKRAPSSTLVTYVCTYHVFLSFQGLDTRFGFTMNLHQAFEKMGIRSFIDHEELKVGEEISLVLTKAIKESRISIIVFSKNYAYSIFCLEELVKILECFKGKGRLVWPIFYKIDPSDVRHIKNSYNEAFDKLGERFGNNSYKVLKWKAALSEAANLKGEHYSGNEYEYDFIERIVERVSRIINRQTLPISSNNLVGLEPRVQSVISLLDGGNEEVKCMVGIYGIGGIGKSTIALAVFNSIADQFEGVCFLANVRENSVGNNRLVQLQQTLLFDTLGAKNIEFRDVNKGIEIIKDRLQQMKVLLILDDVDKLKQLHTLAGGLNWFGRGSRIIITTRDKHLLRVHGVERICEVEGLNDTEAYELFSWNAFKKNEVDPCYTSISTRAVHYCQGLPLALDIIGSNLFDKEPEECRSAFDAYERNPSKDIVEVLKVSYDGLEENEKVIFLDIACFFKGYQLGYVEDILQNGRGFDPKYSIGVLVEKSLVKIDPIKHVIIMHDLIQDMGKDIVRQQSPLRPGEWSRLWFYEDVLHVLEENMGTDKNEFIMLDLPEDEEVIWDGEAFKDMKSLVVLIIKNGRFSEAPKHLPNSLRLLDWKGYPSSSLPQDFHPRKLTILNLTNGLLALDKSLQKFKLLTDMDLSDNKILERITDISGLCNLRRLNLKECINLIEVHDSIGHLDKLRELYATGCSKLKIFPHSLRSTCLHHLDFSRCLVLPSFPEIYENGLTSLAICVYGAAFHGFDCSILALECAADFVMLRCGISMFSKLSRFKDGSIEESSKVRILHIQESYRKNGVLPTCFPWFTTLKVLDLTANKLTDEFFSTRLPWFPNLTELVLTANDFTILPAWINQYCYLRTLVLDKCYQLCEIKGIPSSLKDFSAMHCTSLTSQSSNVLLSEELHKSGGTYFVLPGSLIPDWFDHYCMGSSLSFWFRKKIPWIAICVAYSSGCLFSQHNIQVQVNRYVECQTIPPLGLLYKDHVCLFDLQNIFPSIWSDEAMKEYIGHDWNHIEVRLRRNIRWMGVYVYKQNPNTEDVRFQNPSI